VAVAVDELALVTSSQRRLRLQPALSRGNATAPSNVFNLLGVSVWYQQLLKGAIMLLGAAAYVGRRELAGK
jgi:hypothetical protein